MIEGGYYIKARKVQESEIAFAPPHVREIWDWILKECNHKEAKGIKRGQCVRSYREIQEGLHWMIGYRKMKYKKHHCENAMKWLKKATMVTTMKTTRGIVITVCNYDYYQDPKNYESYTKADTKATMLPSGTDTINKNGKNVENEIENPEPPKIKKSSPFLESEKKEKEKSSGEKEKEWNGTKGRKITGEKLVWFENIWEAFNHKKAKAVAIDSFLDIKNMNRELALKIYEAAKITASERKKLEDKGGTPKFLQGWLSDRRWEDYADYKQNKKEYL